MIVGYTFIVVHDDEAGDDCGLHIHCSAAFSDPSGDENGGSLYPQD